MFIQSLCEQLGIDTENGQPCYEDMFYFEWERNKLPLDIKPEDLGEDESLVRRKLGQLLLQGIDKPAAYVLPLDYDYAQSNWKSCSGH